MSSRPLARLMAGASLFTLAATGLAHAAALEQAVPSVTRVLFENGNYAEFGVTYTNPRQSGDGVIVVPPNGGLPFPAQGNTGNLFEDRWNTSAAFKGVINDRFSYALIYDQPYAADSNYDNSAFTFAGTPVFSYGGTRADVNTYQLTGVVAYDPTPNVKLYGGVRAERLDATAAVLFVDGYSVDAKEDWGYGYMLGAAYQRPDIALRVSLTYYSKIKHSLDTTEFTATNGIQNTTTDVDTPQSVSLDFQTGVAPKTLVFGSVRWVDWTQFLVEPPVYVLASGGRPLVDYKADWWTYTLGVGRQLTDRLAGSVAVTWEPSTDEELTTLGPFDGRTTGTVALSYVVGQITVAGGVTYGKLGDARNLLQTDFNDGSVWGAGLRVGYNF